MNDDNDDEDEWRVLMDQYVEGTLPVSERDDFVEWTCSKRQRIAAIRSQGGWCWAEIVRLGQQSKAAEPDAETAGLIVDKLLKADPNNVFGLYEMGLCRYDRYDDDGYREAYSLFERSARLGCKEAYCMMGVCHHQGDGRPRDLYAAARYFHMAMWDKKALYHLREIRRENIDAACPWGVWRPELRQEFVIDEVWQRMFTLLLCHGRQGNLVNTLPGREIVLIILGYVCTRP